MLTRRNLLAGAALPAPAARRPPNIVLLMADDQRPDTIHALGNRLIRTPNLDRLVRDGVSFTRATCSNPVCVASRAELITGATSFRNGVPRTNRLNPALALWPDVLRRNGYDTCYSGKWHHDGKPSDKGFTATAGLYTGGGRRFMKPRVDWKGREVTGYTGWIFESEDGKPRPELGVGLTPGISETIADAACRYIRGRADKPYFLHVSFTAPHDPLLFPPGFEKMYDPAKMPLPVNFLPEHPFDHGNSRGRDELLMTFPRTAGEVREELACYYAVISHLDRQVGRVLDTLRETGQDRDTIVIYTADNGLAIGSHGLRGKQNMYEHSVNVPLIVRGPGIARGLRTDAQVYLRDLFPATCDAAGIPVPETVSGKSILPVLTKRAKSIRDEVYCYFGDVQRMIRTDRWKFAWYPHIGREQLFDMRTDPHELRDRIADASVASTAADLRTRLKAWLRREGDPVITA
jgi:arylsulfatase A-like enzyme